jgi:hypothetical protein
MATPLPRLRLDLEFMPSPLPDQPGIFIRDPYRYTDAAIIVPPVLAEGLAFFDGEKTGLDLQAHLVRRTGEIVPMEVVGQMTEALLTHGFLHTAEFEQMKDSKLRAFRDAALRLAIHNGSAYPDDAATLRQRLDEFCRDGHPPAPASVLEDAAGKLIALAAPHVSPEGGWRSYAAAYGRIGPAFADKTFIILGTSHYGPPEKFGLTRKPFVTPLGTLDPDLALIDRLVERGGEAFELEDYCHSIEHSIEFQCVFLQHRLGNGAKIVPILCGPLAESLVFKSDPE